MRSRCSELVSMLCAVLPAQAGEVRVGVLALEVAELHLLREQLLRALAGRRSGTRSCRGAGWRPAARAGRRSPPCRRRRSYGASSIFLSSMSCRMRSMMSPICSMLIVNDMMSVQRRLSSFVERLAGDLRQVELDRRCRARRRRRPACAARSDSARSLVLITVSMPFSIVSTTSPMRSASRAALEIASAGVSSADGSRWRGLVRPSLGRGSGSQRSAMRADQLGEADEEHREHDVEDQVELHDLRRASGRAAASSDVHLRQERR